MGIVRNKEALCRRGRVTLRRTALEIAEAGLVALDPQRALRTSLDRDGDNLVVAGTSHYLNRRVHLLGAGKATLAVATALEELLGETLDGGIIIVPESHSRALERTTVLVGDHPFPGEQSTRAGRQIMEYASSIGPDDLVVCAFTGGSSALVSVPPESVPESAKRELHAALLMSGLDVIKMNTVRKHVSNVKGGRLAKLLGAAQIINLTVSDVAGDRLDAITDPTVEDTTTSGDAIEVLKDAGLWTEVDQSIRSHLESRDSESPDLDGTAIQTVLAANGMTACEAMGVRAKEIGVGSRVVSTDWEGDAADYGRYLAALATRGEPRNRQTVLIGCGGETTVRLAGKESAGAGGPNQELAVAAALALNGTRPTALFAIDTDGSDGGTPMAGGLVDDETAALWSAAGIDAMALLSHHRSTRALVEIDQAIDTGPTFTNVNDLFVVVVGSREP